MDTQRKIDIVLQFEVVRSGQSGKSTRLYEACDIFVRQLTRGTAKELSKMDILMNEEEQETGDYVVVLSLFTLTCSFASIA